VEVGRRSVCAMSLLALSVLALPALSAEVTAIPPELGLRAHLTYAGSSLSGGLVEGGQRVASRRITRHDLALGAEFAPIPWLAASLELELTPSLRYRYPEAREMVLEPLTGSGSYLSGEASAETPTVTASGLQGLWVGVAASPIPSAPGRGVWRLDAALRTPSKNRNLWTEPKGSRGAAPGGSAVRLAGAFSTQMGVAEPWLRAELVREGKVEVDVVDDGTTWATDLPLRPASTFDTDFGGEFLAWRNAEAGAKMSVNTWLGGGYRSWEDIATGVYLPNVLAGARRIPVTAGDTLEARAGLEAIVDVNEALGFRAATTFTWFLPYRLEHVYAVETTADTLRVGFLFTVLGGAELSR
jgi:hypothetical protein